ncbi:MAG: hypothetical protein J3Q66DRAFT_176869 [Benniella sp.]|nr:MAG: hypothetical protein J3Q66DRAFT_176869 [Benniella sp.]
MNSVTQTVETGLQRAMRIHCSHGVHKAPFHKSSLTDLESSTTGLIQKSQLAALFFGASTTQQGQDEAWVNVSNDLRILGCTRLVELNLRYDHQPHSHPILFSRIVFWLQEPASCTLFKPFAPPPSFDANGKPLVSYAGWTQDTLPQPFAVTLPFGFSRPPKLPALSLLPDWWCELTEASPAHHPIHPHLRPCSPSKILPGTKI